MTDRIHRLTLDELPDCLALAQDREWLPEERKWRLLFDVGAVYGLRDEAGDLVGTTILTRYGAQLAAISMVLVAARYGGRGLGRQLMQHALAEAGDATVFLNATEYGRPLYEKLGFVSVGTTYTHVGRPGFAEQLRVVERGGVVSGYAGAWRNVDNVLIGPVLAETVDDAKTLIADLAVTISGPVRLDLDDRHPQLREWATQHAVPVRNSTAVMVHGARPLPGDRGRWFIPLVQALG